MTTCALKPKHPESAYLSVRTIEGLYEGAEVDVLDETRTVQAVAWMSVGATASLACRGERIIAVAALQGGGYIVAARGGPNDHNRDSQGLTDKRVYAADYTQMVNTLCEIQAQSYVPILGKTIKIAERTTP